MDIAVIGAGSWGTTLARLLAQKGYAVRLWAYEAELVEEIRTTHNNSLYLDGFTLPDTLEATDDLKWAVENAQMIVIVTPSQNVRAVLTQCRAYIAKDALIVCCSKGIEISTNRLMSQVLEETLVGHLRGCFTFLSGPSFALEVAKEYPTAVVIAGSDEAIAQRVQQAFRTPYFMTFTHHDVVGVELGGALKNVLAIATGIVQGLGFGHNTQTALLTRGLYEMIKLGQVFGAEPLTFAGLAGMGDLVLTCTGGLSRNRQVGIALGEGKSLDEILKHTRTVAEGVATARAVHDLLILHDVHAPICNAVYEILYEGKTPHEAMRELTSRELKQELRALFTVEYKPER